ncbi:MAG: ferrochelatase [Vampirovibrio sp.]|nr:ferrochelatase [Vampirovibrio sp.]
MTSTEKLGVLFLNLGGPDSPKAIRPFLMNLFSDPDIFRLPISWLMQKPLAWYIVTSRIEEVIENYEKIGGRSPILPLTQAQGHALEDRLGLDGVDAKVYIAMRYWNPMTDEAVQQMMADGVTHLVVLPLYPQYSYSTTGSSLNELDRVMALRNYFPKMTTVESFYKLPLYQSAIAETIQDGLNDHQSDWSCPREEVLILFSAHSLPKKFVEKTGDPYPDQIRETIELIMSNYFPNNNWELCYQSKVGNMPWLGPDTDGILHYFAATHVENILIVPISFVSDHIETLFEIDQLYLPLAKDLGIPQCHRTRGLNSDPKFIDALAHLVKSALRNDLKLDIEASPATPLEVASNP